MVWGTLFQIGASVLLGAAVGYGVAAIIEALSKSFSDLWQGFVEATRQIWGYVTEATEHLLASIAQWLESNWEEIEAYLNQEIGYRRDWIVATFQHEQNIFVGFADGFTAESRSALISIGPASSNEDIQLPTHQNPIMTELTLGA